MSYQNISIGLRGRLMIFDITETFAALSRSMPRYLMRDKSEFEKLYDNIILWTILHANFLK